MTNSALPNFFILGAAKAGTTTLYDLLRQHPEIYLSFDKEPMFFSNDERYALGAHWYSQTFFQGGEDYATRGEASPHYLYWAQKVAPRIKQMDDTGVVKFIIILREPVQRGYSWYWNMIKDGYESLSFIEALKAEESRIRQNLAKFEYYGSMQYGYFRGGCYASQIQEYTAYFPKNRFLIILLEDLQKNQTNILRNIFKFLSVDPKIEIISKKSNSSVTPRNQFIHEYIKMASNLKDLTRLLLPYNIRYYLKSLLLKVNMREFTYPPMESEAVGYLKKRCTPEVTNLSKIIERDLSHWS